MLVATETRFVYQFGRKRYDLSARTYIVGILNVTPDSFFDGGRYVDVGRAVDRALEMVEQGADIIDVGGESTRPKSKAYGEGAEVVPVAEELRRVIPVIEQLTRHTDIPISIDTYKSEVAREALGAGASIVNDISGFRFDEGMAAVIAQAQASAVVMHIRGTPGTMQLDPRYDDLFGEIISYLREGVEIGRHCGIRQMLVDPGIGFGKKVEDNLRLISGLSKLSVLGCPILVGPSRKSFIGEILNLPTEDCLEGSVASVVACILSGAHVVRVHDVKEAKRAAILTDAVKTARSSI